MEDIVIRNGLIVDGTGKPPFMGDVSVKDGKISGVGTVNGSDARKIIDAGGRCVTPGFIDIHRHADLRVFSHDFGKAEIFQGITTCISGNCGMSAAPCIEGKGNILYGYLEPCLGRPVHNKGFYAFSEYVKEVSALPLPVNFGNFVGSGTIRIAVKGFDPSPMSAEEMEAAKGMVAEAMEAGAFGLSMGIMYSPECYYSVGEMIELAKTAGKYGGILVTHMRGEGDSLPDSVAEVLHIGSQAEIPLHISHLKAAGRNNWGTAIYKAFNLIESAKAARQDVTCDVYPYEAGSTMLLTVIPPKLLAGGVGKALEYIGSATGREKLRQELSKKHEDWDNLVLSLGWDRVVISSAAAGENQRYIGKSILAIAEEMGCDEVDAVCSLLLSENGKVGIVIFSMSPEDVCEVIKKPYSLIISDSIYPAAGNPHPRLYGAFPRVLAKYVRDKSILPLEEAVKKMTSMPARRLGISKLGEIKEGNRADLLLFELSKIMDMATYEKPVRLANGIDLALIEGRPAIEDNQFVSMDSGQFLIRK
ncbi:MAG TPA: D-aminoacylase [Ruminiclostridium sp.]|nr:D-aminoacylase [Ruminiclostridium sp.]